MDEHYKVYQLEKPLGSGPWDSVRMWASKCLSEPNDVFRVGEPVHLRNIMLVDMNQEEPRTNRNTVWWIQAFVRDEDRYYEEAEVVVTLDRAGEQSTTKVPVLELEKLNDMLRLAVEYAH